MKEHRARTCKLPIKCVDCGEKIWCYTDEELQELEKGERKK